MIEGTMKIVRIKKQSTNGMILSTKGGNKDISGRMVQLFIDLCGSMCIFSGTMCNSYITELHRETTELHREKFKEKEGQA